MPQFGVRHSPRTGAWERPIRRRTALLDLDEFWLQAKRAYRRLAKRAHPDRGGTPADMVALTEALETVERALRRERARRGDEPWPFLHWETNVRRLRRGRETLAKVRGD